MKTICFVGFLLCFGGLAATASGQTEGLAATAAVSTQTDHLNKLAAETESALKSGNYKRVIELTYPKVVEMMGGRDPAVASMQNAFKTIKIVDVEADDAGTIVTSGDKQFSVVPNKMRLQINDKTISTKGYLLAISEDQGKHWSFVDGAGLQSAADPKEKAKMFGLNLPDDLTLPAEEEAIVESE